MTGNFRNVSPRKFSDCRLSLFNLALVLFLFDVFTHGAVAATSSPTATTLAVTPSSISAQQIATLTASIESTGAPVTVGTVSFYDGKLYLGSVQVVHDTSHGYAAGTATLKTALRVGTHSKTATFLPTASLASSSSAIETVVVGPSASTGLGATNLTLAASGLPLNNTQLTATLSAAGSSRPTGSVIFSDQTSSTQLGTVMVNPSSFSAGYSPIFSFSDSGSYYLFTADLNVDGLPDILAVVYNSSGTALQPYLNQGNGTFKAAEPILTPLPQGTSIPILVADFNGDGIPDLTFASADNVLSVLICAGDGTFPFNESLIASGAISAYNPGLPAIGDFNGDGIPGLILTTSSNAVNIPVMDSQELSSSVVRGFPQTVHAVFRPRRL